MNHCQQIKYNARLKFLQFPPRFQGANLSQFLLDIKKVSLDASFITGPVGTGKTHLMFALVENAVRQNINCPMKFVWYEGKYEEALIVYQASLLRVFSEIKSIFSQQNEKTEEEIIKKYCITKNLFLDDFGVHRGTDWEFTVIYRILDYRWSHNLRTVVTSNCTIQELSDSYGERLASRIVGTGIVLALKGEDRRNQMGKEMEEHKQETKTSSYDLQKSDIELEAEATQMKKDQKEKLRISRLENE